MAIRKILRSGHPVLRQVAFELTPSQIKSTEIKSLIEDMVQTLADSGGIGLAAPQVGESIRLAIIDIKGGPTRYGDLKPHPLAVYINPKVTVLDPNTCRHWEGCLSLPGLRGLVERPSHIRIDYLDHEGQPKQLEVHDFLAAVFQHEFDHLDGCLYVDRLVDSRSLVFETELGQYGAPWIQDTADLPRQDDTDLELQAE